MLVQSIINECVEQNHVFMKMQIVLEIHCRWNIIYRGLIYSLSEVYCTKSQNTIIYNIIAKRGIHQLKFLSLKQLLDFLRDLCKSITVPFFCIITFISVILYCMPTKYKEIYALPHASWSFLLICTNSSHKSTRQKILRILFMNKCL